MTGFRTEAEMGDVFLEWLESCNSDNTEIHREYKTPIGIPDFVLFNQEGDELSVVTFELKLTKWRRALAQAFRHKSFADQSFVVLDWKVRKSVESYLDEFMSAGVGICFLNTDGQIEVVSEAQKCKPYSQQVTRSVHETYLTKSEMVRC